MKKFRHILSRLPVLLGASALLTYGARAAVTDGSTSENASANAARAGEIIVKIDNDQISFSEDAGRTFERLELMGTPEAARLQELLMQRSGSSGAAAVKVSPTVVADGAGGMQWARPNPPEATNSGNAA
jgi:hypothetical protein